MSDALRVERLNKCYGGIVVADNVDLALQHGTCLGVIGPNGAGKSSMFNLIDGSVRPDAGRILLNGIDITPLSHHRRARRGIARAFQIPQPFPDLTVFENVLIAATFGAGLSGADAGRSAMATLDRTGLADHRHLLAGSLGLLDRKRLELAKAMAAAPKVMLLDEIAGGLTEPEVRLLIELVHSLKQDHAIIWIEHVVHALMATVDAILVLNFGRCVAQGDPRSVMASPEVREIYMGIAVDVAAHG
jgi:branched-chain amino acid transport system ATP-binding protein